MRFRLSIHNFGSYSKNSIGCQNTWLVPPQLANIHPFFPFPSFHPPTPYPHSPSLPFPSLPPIYPISFGLFANIFHTLSVSCLFPGNYSQVQYPNQFFTYPTAFVIIKQLLFLEFDNLNSHPPAINDLLLLLQFAEIRPKEFEIKVSKSFETFHFVSSVLYSILGVQGDIKAILITFSSFSWVFLLFLLSQRWSAQVFADLKILKFHPKIFWRSRRRITKNLPNIEFFSKRDIFHS